MSLTEGDSTPNGVRVSNAQIYDLLMKTRDDVSSVKQTVEDVVKPGLNTALTAVTALTAGKAEKSAVEKIADRLDRIELRVYAIFAGIVAAALGAKGVGMF